MHIERVKLHKKHNINVDIGVQADVQDQSFNLKRNRTAQVLLPLQKRQHRETLPLEKPKRLPVNKLPPTFQVANNERKLLPQPPNQDLHMIEPVNQTVITNQEGLSFHTRHNDSLSVIELAD